LDEKRIPRANQVSFLLVKNLESLVFRANYWKNWLSIFSKKAINIHSNRLADGLAGFSLRTVQICFGAPFLNLRYTTSSTLICRKYRWEVWHV